MKNKYLLIFVCLSSGFFCSAQESDSYSHFSSWNSITPKVNINEHIYAKSEFHIRRTNFLNVWEQFLVRPSFHYKLNSTYDFSVGYSFVHNYVYSDFSVPINANENNIWEQVALSHKEGKFGFNHRFRFEQRFIDKIASKANDDFGIDGTNYANRFRYRFTVLRPIFKLSADKSVSFKFFDEIFLSLNNGLEPIDLNQNWFYLGFSIPVSNTINLGLGYHHIGLAKGNEVFLSDEILETSISLNL